jgi:hypothetical protein
VLFNWQRVPSVSTHTHQAGLPFWQRMPSSNQMKCIHIQVDCRIHSKVSEPIAARFGPPLIVECLFNCQINFISIKANANLQITNNYQQGAAPHSNIGELFVSSKCNPTYNGVQTANKSLNQIAGYSNLMMNANHPELIVKCSYIASSFQDFSSNTS